MTLGNWNYLCNIVRLTGRRRIVGLQTFVLIVTSHPYWSRSHFSSSGYPHLRRFRIQPLQHPNGVLFQPGSG